MTEVQKLENQTTELQKEIGDLEADLAAGLFLQCLKLRHNAVAAKEKIRVTSLARRKHLAAEDSHKIPK